jgi:aryl-alcohol dehydrogenase-like predicted oxidoreductase
LTKVFFAVGKTPETKTLGSPNLDADGYVNQRGLSRKHIFESIKASLERLQLDYVDVLQCHRFDPETPIEETMQALHDVVQAGYARYIGMSSCWAYQFHQMQNYAISKGLTPFISMQDFHNAIYREEEREMFPTLEHFGVGAIPWSPLASGFLTRPLGEQTKRSETDNYFKGFKNSLQESDNEINRKVDEIAKKKGVKMAQVAVAYELSKSVIAAPIVGTTKLESLKELADAIHIKLTEEEVKAIEEPYVARSVYGHQ